MEFTDVLESIEKFKKRFEKEDFIMTLEEFDNIFYIKNFFYSYDNLYTEDDFYEIVLQMSNIILKNSLGEAEYYVNLKPSTELTNIDYEIVSKKQDEYGKYNLIMYRLYREFVQINLERKEATHFVIDFIQKVYDFILEYKEFAKSINLEVLKLIDKKIIDFSSKEEKNKIESSLFY